MNVKFLTMSAIAAVAFSSAPAFAQQVNIDGSSTVFPVSEAFAEEFQIKTGTRVVVGVSGTGGGFKKFCRGETDISGASRPIKTSEMELCAENGVEFIELPVALDALSVIVNPENDWVSCMTVEELKTAYEPEAQGKIDNWNQIGDYPDAPLNLFGAGTDSGTYDYFTAAIVGEEHSSRGDYTATEDDNITIQGVSSDVNAMGFLGLAYVEENRSRVKAVSIKQPDGTCVEPTVETARDASYQPLSRPLFVYLSKGSLDEKQSVRDFADFIMDPEHAESLVAEVGYVPLPDEAFKQGKAKVDARRTGSFFGGESKIGVKISDLLAH